MDSLFHNHCCYLAGCQTVKRTTQAAVSCDAAFYCFCTLASLDQLYAMRTFISHVVACQMPSQEVASHAANALTPLCLVCAAETA